MAVYRRYRTHVMKVDTKKYGLPQTRNRKYMFAWRPDVAPLRGVADVGERWEQLMRNFECELQARTAHDSPSF